MVAEIAALGGIEKPTKKWRSGAAVSFLLFFFLVLGVKSVVGRYL